MRECRPPSHPLTPSQMGFFAEAGPLQVFVSNHLIPEAFEFNSTHEPCYVTADGEQKIAAAADVRLRIVGTRIDANEIVRSGSEGMRRYGPAHAATEAPAFRK